MSSSSSSLSPLQRATLQAAILNITSTILAQLLRKYKLTSSLSHSLTSIELLPILHFLFWCLASTPPNFLWQEYLEARFPGYPSASDAGRGVSGGKVKGDDDEKVVTGARKLNVRNTFTKLLFDQTVGAAVNNAGFLIGITLVRGGSWADAMNALKEFWPIMIAAWKVWPLVSLFNFLVVPVERRIVVGATVGLFWGIYMVLRVS